MTKEELKKIKVVDVKNNYPCYIQKITFDCPYFVRLEVIKRVGDDMRFIIIEENRTDKFYMIIPFNTKTFLKLGDEVTYNTYI